MSLLVDLQEIDSLPNIYHPGMLIRCVVEKLDTSKSGLLNIKLSLNPQQVNKNLSSAALKTGMVRRLKTVATCCDQFLLVNRRSSLNGLIIL